MEFKLNYADKKRVWHEKFVAIFIYKLCFNSKKLLKSVCVNRLAKLLKAKRARYKNLIHLNQEC